MRLVQVLIPNGSRESVLAVLDGEEIDYAVWEETGRGDFEALVSFPVPPSGVEPILERLYESGIRDDAYTIVMATETVVSSRIDALKQRYSDVRISREELLARADDLAPRNSTFFAFILLSTVIAAAGLLLDSAATIIGAMVIAPLMGPAISASVGTVLDERQLARRGVLLQVTGLLAAIAVGAVVGWLLKESVLLPPGLDIREIGQVAERISPNFLSLFLALGSGLAGAISLIRNTGSTLVGVAIAVALIPPAATSGLGIAWGLPLVAIPAAVLVLVNLLAINLSALVMFWLSGYRPLDTAQTGTARRSVISRVGTIAVGIAALSIVLAVVTLVSFQIGVFEQQVATETELLVDGVGGGIEYISASTDYDGVSMLLDEPATVEVLVGRSNSATAPPDLATRIDDRLTAATGRDVVVRVGVLEAQQSS
ncbi:TIGR00341 family protein [Halogranum amylolyticum]|uniref:TIGR00341 family protein n=1 Tax=Halogranum amylolyticum TaxID=660520 RepID=A0A1H8USU7_9EURY|nr:TIGR00341 family protein [Halogranum amylolyticum]SEP06083.1 TIGR00341 family protein [Halogranum amylolyticum]